MVDTVPSFHSSPHVLVWWADIPAGHIRGVPATSISSGDAGASVTTSHLQANERLETQMEIKARQKDSWSLLVQPGAWKS